MRALVRGASIGPAAARAVRRRRLVLPEHEGLAEERERERRVVDEVGDERDGVPLVVPIVRRRLARGVFRRGGGRGGGRDRGRDEGGPARGRAARGEERRRRGAADGDARGG
eukprot:18409-Pelagococcus_subviridis.AAC.1